MVLCKMTMMRKLHKIRIRLSLSLLIALSSVFLCNYLCDLGILDIRIYSGNQVGSLYHTHSSKKGHENHFSGDHHEHQISGIHQDHHDHSDSHHEEKDECCKEETSKLLASLVNYELPTFETEKVPVLLYAVIFDVNYTNFHFHKNTDPHQLNSSLSPPVTGSFIRVLIQSFLC